MTEAPETSETPSGHLRWVEREEYQPDPRLGHNMGRAVKIRVLQQQFYLTTYRGTSVEQTAEWRDVPLVSEERGPCTLSAVGLLYTHDAARV